MTLSLGLGLCCVLLSPCLVMAQVPVENQDAGAIFVRPGEAQELISHVKAAAEPLHLKQICAEAANAYLSSHRDKFGLRPGVPLPAIKENEDCSIIYENQKYKGVEVLGSGIRLDVDAKDKKVYSSAGEYQREENISVSVTIPKIDSKQAIEAVIGQTVVDSNFGGPCCPRTISKRDITKVPRLVILPVDNDLPTARLTWEIPACNDFWYLYVDAQTGQVIRKFKNYDS